MYVVWGWAHQRRRRAEHLTGQASVPSHRPAFPTPAAQPHYTDP